MAEYKFYLFYVYSGIIGLTYNM